MELTINKTVYTIRSEDFEIPLLWFIRDHIGFTGTKYGCGIGVCGSCTVLIDGDPMPSCLVPLKRLLNKDITTIEGLSKNKFPPCSESLGRVTGSSMRLLSVGSNSNHRIFIG